ncbi:MAG TPA: COX15/CtaA family protein [Dehalococcoidia bacterium]|nr:COX15/CtaA family protein [Dehalococcoidia bacterium]
MDLRVLGIITVLATYVLIVIGGTVRATDSGTACPDWPLCHGQVIPPPETKVWIEFTHRLVASVVGFMIIGMVVQVWRNYRPRAPMKWAGVATIILLATQVIVGGITVGTETAAGVVAIHLTIALTLISLLIFITASAWSDEAPSLRHARPMTLIALLGVFALIISGAFVSQLEAGLAYPDWPLFDGKLAPVNSEAGHLHYTHRVIAGLVGLAVLGVFYSAWRRGASPVIVWALAAAVVLFVVQSLFGAANVWLDLTTSVRIIHLALASAVWAVLVFSLVWAATRPSQAFGES